MLSFSKKHLVWMRSNCNPDNVEFLKERLGDSATMCRTYNALTEAIGALKLQEPKRAEVYTRNMHTDAFCPSCNEMIFYLAPDENVNKYPSYCLWCGQKLDWSDSDE